jgi:hypothetical protein
MSEKKVINMESPNLNKLQAVFIDHKTTIYIAKDANPEEARKRYLARIKRQETELS